MDDAKEKLTGVSKGVRGFWNGSRRPEGCAFGEWVVLKRMEGLFPACSVAETAGQTQCVGC